MIPIHLAVEDDLSEFVLRHVLATRPVDYHIGPVFKKGGFGYLKKQCKAFNNLAKGSAVLLLTDLDQHLCPPELISSWLQEPLNPRFLFRVAVTEVEAWLLANDSELRSFLGVRKILDFSEPETLADPKAELLKLAASSRKREIRESLTRKDSGGNIRQGPAYNATLAPFVSDSLSINTTAEKCPSFRRMLRALEALEESF